MSIPPEHGPQNGTSDEPISVTAVPKHVCEFFSEACNCRDNYQPDEDCICGKSAKSELLISSPRRPNRVASSSSSFPRRYSYFDSGSVYSHSPHLKAIPTSYPIAESFQAYLQRRPLSSVLREKYGYENAEEKVQPVYVPLLQPYLVSPFCMPTTIDYYYYPEYYYLSNQIYMPSYCTLLSPTIVTTTTTTINPSEVVPSNASKMRITSDSQTGRSTSAVADFKPSATTSSTAPSPSAVSSSTKTSTAVVGMEGSVKPKEKDEDLKLLGDVPKKRKHLRSTSQPVKKVEENIVTSTTSVSPPPATDHHLVKKVEDNEVTVGSINTQSTTIPSEPKSSDWPTLSSSVSDRSASDEGLSSSVINPSRIISSSPISYTSSSYIPSYYPEIQPSFSYSVPCVIPQTSYSYNGNGRLQSSYYGNEWRLGFVPYPPPTVRYLNICGFDYPQGGSFHLSSRGKELLGVL